MESIDTYLEDLRKVYCPPVDDATFYAIAQDYDLPRDQRDFTSVLDQIKADAAEEDNSSFDPSGTGGGVLHQFDQATNVSRSTPEETSISNDLTSITSDFADVRLIDSTNIGKDIGHFSLEGQIEWLLGLFPSLTPEQIRTALESTSSPDQAVEELLNFSFLANDTDVIGNQELPRGIDGFAEEVLGTRRKGRGNKKGRQTDSPRAGSAGSYASESPASPNVWNAAASDVEFICSKTTVPSHVVRSAYHANGASLAMTIRAFAEKEGAKWTTAKKWEEILELQVAELRPDFATVPDAHIYGLLHLTRNIPSAAYELLEAMTASGNVENAPIGKVIGLAQYAPLDLEPRNKPPVAEETWTTVAGNTKQLAAAHNLAVSQAFGQAAAAAKKAKSNSLFGGAATYYSQEGYENLRKSKELRAARANTLVDAQSTPGMLDLHGVDVQNAVRITRYKVQQWWDSLGDAKYAPGGGGLVRAGYQIVTGVGTHSKNHAPRIGPAVSRMLVNEGWKVEVGHGQVAVVGKQRRH